MRKDFEKLFTHLTPMEPPEGLLNKIMLRIQKEQKFLMIKRRIMFLSIGIVGIIVSAAAFIPAFKATQTGLNESGFIYFLSLIFSDFEIVAVSWQNFVMSLLETLPIMSFATLFAIIFIFLGSVKFLIKSVPHSTQLKLTRA